MKNPGTILKLWNKTVKKHEEGKKPEEMPKKGQAQKIKIKKGLMTLKLKAPATEGNPAAQGKFVALRDRVVTVMKKYCLYLKTSKDEDKKALPKYMKTVKQLTVVVQKLDPTSLDANEEDVSLDTLEAVDTAALEEALANPDLANEPDVDLDAALDDDEAPEDGDEALDASDTAPEAPPQPAVQPPHKQLRDAMAKLSPQLRAAAAAQPARKNEFLGAEIRFLQELKNNEPEKAKKALLDAANLLKTPPAAPAAAPAGQDEWKAGLAALTPKLKKALESGAGNQDGIKKLFTKSSDLAKGLDYRQANIGLKALGGLVDAALAAAAKQSASANGAAPSAAQQPASANGAPSAAKAVQSWEAARKSAADQLALLQKELESEDDPVAKQAAVEVAKILPNLDERLSAAVQQYEAARTANGDAAALASKRTAALQIVDTVLAYVSGGGLLARLDDNPDYPMNLGGPLQQSLKQLQADLAPA